MTRLKTDLEVIKGQVGRLESDVSVIKKTVSVLETDVKEVKSDVKEILEVVNKDKGAAGYKSTWLPAAGTLMSIGVGIATIITLIAKL